MTSAPVFGTEYPDQPPPPTVTIDDTSALDGWHVAVVRVAGRDGSYLWLWWEG